MLRPFLLSLLFLFFAQSAPAQCTKKAAELPAAPELYGFRLGMTKEQIKAVVAQTHFGHTDHFGVAKTTINPHFDATIDQTKYEGVRSISLDLLDEKLTSMWIGFEETYKVPTEGEFVKFISQALQLPGSWSSYRSRGQQLRCADFQLIVTIVARGPSFRLIDASAEDTIAARRQAKEEQDSAAEAAAEAGNGESGESVVEIIADKQSKTYYANACQPTKQISENNKVTFKTTTDAEKAGFKPAKNCRQAIAN
jgi:hypothetical protein